MCSTSGLAAGGGSDAIPVKAARKLRDLPGVLIKDLPKIARALARPVQPGRSDLRGWISICNRAERLVPASDGPGYGCEWQWGSRLHSAEVIPAIGWGMMRAALREWPIVLAREPRLACGEPKVSFVYAHAGRDRLSQLHRAIASVFAQRDVPCEVIVVDQSKESLLGQMPTPINYLHLAKDNVAEGWHKAWAYNVGARLARGSILVFQDGDICVPESYAQSLVEAIDDRGHGAASLQRFLFYLKQHAVPTFDGSALLSIEPVIPDCTFQNWKGGTIAVRREAFEAIGGFDEGFVDWGGEDDEFYDRCAHIGHCRHGFLPFVHLWHQPQVDRHLPTNRNTTDVLPWRLSIPVDQRVSELASRSWGVTVRPDPATSYKSGRES